MSIGRIALGVFLGNLLFGVVAAIVVSFVSASMQADARVQQAKEDSAEFTSRIRTERYMRCLHDNEAAKQDGKPQGKPCELP